MGAIDWLVCRQTPEEELRLEVETREILNNENSEEIAWLCANLYKQNYMKDQIIKNCLGRIGELEAINVKRELDKERFWFMRWFD